MQPRRSLPAPLRALTGPLARLRAAGLALALLAPSAGAAEPRPNPPGEPPRLVETQAHQSQAAWMAAKNEPPTRQLAAVLKRGLMAQRCTDLIDLRPLAERGALPGFGFRDNVRGRSWARPTLALVLSEAMKRFRAELGPGRANDKLISIGDVSQPGCGQVAHGVLVTELGGKPAADLLARTRLVEGEPTLKELKTAADFPWEADRFGPPTERVMVLSRVLGVDQGKAPDDLTLRIARTRYRELAAPTPEELTALVAEVSAELKAGPVDSRKVMTANASGALEPVFVSHYIQPSKKRQLVLVTKKKPGKRPDWADILEVRAASWQDKKPGSFPDEVRWVVESRPTLAPPPPPPRGKRAPVVPPMAPSALRWSRWAMLYEAGHISHLSGIDADLSYVTLNGDRHFAVDLAQMDVALTWRWLELLDETARKLGTPIDTILVDPKVKRHLQQNLPMKGKDGKQKSRVWRLLDLSPGHDAHHHVRLVEATAAQERAAKKALGLP